MNCAVVGVTTSVGEASRVPELINEELEAAEVSGEDVGATTLVIEVAEVEKAELLSETAFELIKGPVVDIPGEELLDVVESIEEVGELSVVIERLWVVVVDGELENDSEVVDTSEANEEELIEDVSAGEDVSIDVVEPSEDADGVPGLEVVGVAVIAAVVGDWLKVMLVVKLIVLLVGLELVI